MYKYWLLNKKNINFLPFVLEGEQQKTGCFEPLGDNKDSFIETFCRYSDIKIILCFLLAVGGFFIYKSFSKSFINFSVNEKKKREDAGVPAEGEDPRWDAFLRDVLATLGLTLAQVSGALLYEIWKAYQFFLQSGNLAGAMEILRLALENLYIVLPQSLPLFILIALIAFVFSTVKRDIDEKNKNDAIEKYKTKRRKELLRDLDKINRSEGFRGYLNSWGFWLRKKIIEWTKG